MEGTSGFLSHTVSSFILYTLNPFNSVNEGIVMSAPNITVFKFRMKQIWQIYYQQWKRVRKCLITRDTSQYFTTWRCLTQDDNGKRRTQLMDFDFIGTFLLGRVGCMYVIHLSFVENFCNPLSIVPFTMFYFACTLHLPKYHSGTLSEHTMTGIILLEQ